MNTLIRTRSYINGKWHIGTDTSNFAIYNPANESLIAELEDAQAVDIELAINSADNALAVWQNHSNKERAAYLKRWYESVLNNQEALASLITEESGKPLAEAKAEVVYAASYMEWFAEEAKRVSGDVIEDGKRQLVTLKQGVGVCGIITPWNFPLAMITRKVAPALAAGCTVVIKPSELTPLTALALAKLAHEVGIPAGVVNVVVTSKSQLAGEMLCKSTLVRKLSFTGSTQVGKILYQQCADNIKKLSLELGGNAAFIVFDDADIAAAVEGCLLAKYRNSGQTCVCANRIFVQEAIFEHFVEKLLAAVSQLKIADGFTEGAKIGPLINQQAVEKMKSLLVSAQADGAEIILGGDVHSEGSSFFQPTILINKKNQGSLNEQEIFGPIANVIAFKTEEQVIQQANDTEYGLAAYFYSENRQRCWRVSRQLEVGMVGVNTGIISTELAPFGGVKQSGLGREGSKYGLDDYQELKYICMA